MQDQGAWSEKGGCSVLCYCGLRATAREMLLAKLRPLGRSVSHTKAPAFRKPLALRSRVAAYQIILSNSVSELGRLRHKGFGIAESCAEARDVQT